MLVVDDEAQVRRNVAAQLMAQGFEVLTAGDADTAVSLAESSPVDVVVADWEMPGVRGIELLHRLKSARGNAETILLASASGLGEAARYASEGAFLVLASPVPSAEMLALAIRRAAEKKRSDDRASQAERRTEEPQRVEVVATSRRMRDAVDAAYAAARLRTPLLLLGEPGTGKALIARAVHQRSPRASRPFALLRCSLGPGQPFDEAIVASARTGTLVLEDLCSLDGASQARLLDVLTSGEPDVRVIACSPVELKERVAAGAFRPDLYYRLNVVVVRVPPLRGRKDDISVLAYHFLHEHGQRVSRALRRISPEALRMLRGYGWPGNVGELQSVMERAAVMARSEVILPADVDQAQDTPDGDREEASSGVLAASVQLPAGFDQVSFSEAKKQFLAAFEHNYGEAMLKRASGNIAEAAHLAGLDRSNFRRILKRGGVKTKGSGEG